MIKSHVSSISGAENTLLTAICLKPDQDHAQWSSGADQKKKKCSSLSTPQIWYFHPCQHLWCDVFILVNTSDVIFSSMSTPQMWYFHLCQHLWCDFFNCANTSDVVFSSLPTPQMWYFHPCQHLRCDIFILANTSNVIQIQVQRRPSSLSATEMWPRPCSVLTLCFSSEPAAVYTLAAGPGMIILWDRRASFAI